MMDEMKRIDEAAAKVLAVCGKADIGVILGSGLGDYAEALEDAVKLPYSEIPGFPRSTVAGHAGMWCCGTLYGKRVVMMQGRFHYYEGYGMKDVTLPVRVMQKIGVKTLIVTNAAGGVNVRPGPSTSGTPGSRARDTMQISCSTAPVSDVTTAIFFGRYGKRRLCSSSNSPSAAKRFFSASNCWYSVPMPSGRILSQVIW